LLLLGAAALAALWVAEPARAQISLGSQRVGTSAGTFLKIGVGARAVSLGESFVAVANDPSTIYWNPAGLASLLQPELALAHVEWPADIRYEHLSFVQPVKALGGSLGFQLGVLSTEMDETTEYQPLGTGRSFFFTDLVAGAAYARRWTDKLLVGFGAKFVHEGLGTDVGGPSINNWLVDIGSIYYLGYGSLRIATALSNFGPQFEPSGTYVAPAGYPNAGEERGYDGFDPPILFRYGLALEPVVTERHQLTTALEVNQPADNEQAIKLGFEWTWQRSFALRSGYNFSADEMRFSAGAGATVIFGTTRGTLDYAYTDGGFLGAVNRVSLGVRF
jgi:hypothetical protein